MIKRSPPKRKPAKALLAWYDANRRDLPWRARPGDVPDPYAVWLSEIMLQQTTVATVKAYYRKFLARWPNVQALAEAPLEEALAEWAGLGYYARARNLHACARMVATDRGGRFPGTAAELLALPGVGPYTAAAIAAIAFNEPCVAVDGNVERVITRLYAIETPARRARPRIHEKAEALLEPSRAGDFAQALMDLGATVCTPRAPNCVACPFVGSCAAFRDRTQEQFPVKEARGRRPNRRGAIFILRRGDDVLLRRRPPRGLFGGMSEFPSTPLALDVALEFMSDHAPCKARWRALNEPVSHVFTHFSLSATVFVARTATDAPPGPNCRWAARDNLDKEGLPTLMRKAAIRAGLIES